MQTHVEFRSNNFPAYPGEEEQINPGHWGKRLAEFIREGLQGEGYEPDEPVAEDWGWVVPVQWKPYPLWIGCSHYGEYEDGYLCFIEPHTPIVRRFLIRKYDAREKITSLQQALDKALSRSDGIRSIRWWTHEEFNNPSSANR
jgi:hypothetical protein